MRFSGINFDVFTFFDILTGGDQINKDNIPF